MTDKSQHHKDHHHHHHHSHNEAVHQHGSDHGHHAAHEHSWKPDDYEKKLKAMNYNGPKLAVDEFVQFDVPKDAKIMDLAAGTGLIGVALAENGYTNIDALDGSDDMLNAARERKCYQNIITHMIERDTKFPIEDFTYDHIVMAGALCHLDFENIPKIIKICKPGGIICWSIGQSEDLVSHEPNFKDGYFEKYIQKLCDEKLWEYLPGFPKRVSNYAMNRDGWVYVMKVL